MPQGSFKKAKSGGSVPKQKQKHQKKPMGLKKGSIQIAPKKAKHQEALKIQKAVEKSIKNNVENVEKEVASLATKSEAKAFKVSVGGESSAAVKSKKS